MPIITAALVTLVLLFVAVTPASARIHHAHKAKSFHLKKVHRRSHHHPTFVAGGDEICTSH